jgi:hypothetical protein
LSKKIFSTPLPHPQIHAQHNRRETQKLTLARRRTSGQPIYPESFKPKQKKSLIVTLRVRIPVCRYRGPNPYTDPHHLPPALPSCTIYQLDRSNKFAFSDPRSELTISGYENSAPFPPPVTWCPPGITKKSIEAVMQGPLQKAASKWEPVDKGVKVWGWKAMERGYERRKKIGDQEIAAHLMTMGLNSSGMLL